jgi:hypothetical protein
MNALPNPDSDDATFSSPPMRWRPEFSWSFSFGNLMVLLSFVIGAIWWAATQQLSSQAMQAQIVILTTQSANLQISVSKLQVDVATLVAQSQQRALDRQYDRQMHGQ